MPFASSSPLLDRFRTWSAKTPGAPAVTDGCTTLSYRALEACVNTLAQRIRSQLPGPSRVAVELPRSIEAVVTFLAIWKAGGSYVPLDKSLPPRRREEFMLDARPALVLGRPRNSPRAGIPFLAVELAELARSGTTEPIHAERTALSEAYVLFTSGSSGQPKGVAIPDQAIARLVLEPDFIDLSPADVVLHFSPVSFDAATFEIWAALLNGAKLAILPEARPSPSSIRRFLREQACTVAWLTSGLFNALVDADPMILQPLRQVLTGGEALSPRHVARARQALPSLTITNGYGPTENTTFTCCHTLPPGIDVAGWNSIPIGRPIKGTTVVIVDENDRPAPDGTPGELLAGGSGLALGYINDDALTAAKFVELPAPAAGRYYRTGDLAFRRPDGLIEFVGRLDDQVKINGFRIEPGEVAHHLKSHPQVEDAVVVAQPAAGSRRLVGYWKPHGPPPGEAELLSWLGERLPPQLVPARLLALPLIPLNARGKVDRAALPNPFAQDRPAINGAESEAPDLPGFLAAVTTALDGARVNPDLSFQAQGGDSLSAMVAIDVWERDAGRSLAVGQLLDRRPLRAVAASARRAANEALRPARHPVVSGDESTGPLSLSQEQIWFSACTRPATLAYNVTCRLEFDARTDPANLHASLDDMFRRHALLHSVLVATAPQRPPVWLRQPDRPLPLTRVNLRHLDPAAARREIERQIAERVREPFELLGSPLIHWYWWDLPGGHTVVLQCEHHLIHDGWSLERILRDWARAYAARSGSPAGDAPAAAAARSYFDFSRWQHRHVADAAGHDSLAFWRRKLTGMPHFSLPAETTAIVDSELGGVLREELPADLVRELWAAAAAAGHSPFEHCLAAFVALLLEESDQAEVGLGVGVANREQAEFRNTAGMFVNVMALRAARPAVAIPWGIWRGRIADELRQALPHQSVPFEAVVKAVNPARQAGRNPLFEVLFSRHQRFGRQDWFDGGLCDYDEALDNGTAKFDLNVYLIQQPSTVAGDPPRVWLRWEYRASRFQPATMQRRFRRYVGLLREELDPAKPWHCPGRTPERSPRPKPPPPADQLPGTAPDERRAHLTMVIASIWREYLPEAQIEADTDFFAVGGHSLLGMQIILGLEEYLGWEIPLNSLFEAPTPARLAGLLMQGTKIPVLALSRLNHGSGRPLIMIHGWAGDAFGMLGLARELDGRLPLLALHVDPRTDPPAASLEQLAEYYATYIDGKLGLPSYDLGGHSVGGVLAWAVALALQRRGKSVGAFVTIDTRPCQIPFGRNLLAHRRWIAHRVRERWAEIRRLSWSRSLRLFARIGDTVLRRTLRASGLPGLRQVPVKTPPGGVADAYQILAAEWTPRRFPGDMDLIWSENTNIDLPLAWSTWVDGKIRTHMVHGPHLELLKPPYVGLVAQSILEIVTRVRDSANADCRR